MKLKTIVLLIILLGFFVGVYFLGKLHGHIQQLQYDIYSYSEGNETFAFYYNNCGNILWPDSDLNYTNRMCLKVKEIYNNRNSYFCGDEERDIYYYTAPIWGPILTGNIITILPENDPFIGQIIIDNNLPTSRPIVIGQNKSTP